MFCFVYYKQTLRIPPMCTVGDVVRYGEYVCTNGLQLLVRVMLF